MKVHVMSKKGRWAVIKDNSSKAHRVYKNKKDAIEKAREFGIDVIIHKKDGVVEKWEVKE